MVQYDFGKIGPGGRLTRTGFLNAPPTILLSALAKFQSNHLTGHSGLSVHLSGLINRQEGFSSRKQDRMSYSNQTMTTSEGKHATSAAETGSWCGLYVENKGPSFIMVR